MLVLLIVFQEGAVLQDVGGDRRLPGQRKKVSVNMSILCAMSPAMRDTDQTRTT
jgi:hypothetical protein